MKARYADLSPAPRSPLMQPFHLPNFAGGRSPRSIEDVNDHPFGYLSATFARPTTRPAFEASAKIEHKFEANDAHRMGCSIRDVSSQSLTADGTSADFARFTYQRRATPASVTQCGQQPASASTTALTGFRAQPARPGIGASPDPLHLQLPPPDRPSGPIARRPATVPSIQIRNQEDISARNPPFASNGDGAR